MIVHPIVNEAECDVYKMVTVENVDYERKVRTCLPTACNLAERLNSRPAMKPLSV